MHASSSPCVPAVAYMQTLYTWTHAPSPHVAIGIAPVASSTTTAGAKGASTVTIRSTATGDAHYVADGTDPTEGDATCVGLRLRCLWRHLCRSNPRRQHRKSTSPEEHCQNGRGATCGILAVQRWTCELSIPGFLQLERMQSKPTRGQPHCCC